ncbi:trichohyalin-like [Procambarus clarkii]|uniref:trichohyalin-like n=1 Tax=Procambarus clarkii TaxID=6728 RepID=UPI0037428372
MLILDVNVKNKKLNFNVNVKNKKLNYNVNVKNKKLNYNVNVKNKKLTYVVEEKSHLTGRAVLTLITLASETDYDVLKQAVLDAYLLSTESYRRRFNVQTLQHEAERQQADLQRQRQEQEADLQHQREEQEAELQRQEQEADLQQQEAEQQRQRQEQEAELQRQREEQEADLRRRREVELLQILAEELQLKRQQEEDGVGITFCLEQGQVAELQRQRQEQEAELQRERQEKEADVRRRREVDLMQILAEELQLKRQQEEDGVGITLCLEQGRSDTALEFPRQELELESTHLSQHREAEANLPLYEQKVELERACEQERLQTLQHEAERQQADLQRQRQEQEAELQRQRQEQEADLQHEQQEAELQRQRQEHEADLQRQRQEQEAEQQRQRQEQEAELQRQRQEQEADLRRRRERELLQIIAEELQLKRQQEEDSVASRYAWNKVDQTPRSSSGARKQFWLYEQEVELERACEQERLQTLQHEAERQQADLQRQRQEQEAELQRQRQEQEADLQRQRQEQEAEQQRQRQEQEAELQRQRQEQEADLRRRREGELLQILAEELQLKRQQEEDRVGITLCLEKGRSDTALEIRRQELELERQVAELQRQRQEQEAELQRERQEKEADVRRRREVDLMQILAEELQLKRQQEEDGVGITLCLEQGRSDTALEFPRQELELESTHLSQHREAEANLPNDSRPCNMKLNVNKLTCNANVKNKKLNYNVNVKNKKLTYNMNEQEAEQQRQRQEQEAELQRQRQEQEADLRRRRERELLQIIAEELQLKRQQEEDRVASRYAWNKVDQTPRSSSGARKQFWLYEQEVELERACEQERLQTLQHEAERQQADLQRQRQEQEAELQRQRQEQEADLQRQRQEQEAEQQRQRQEQEAELQRQRQEQDADLRRRREGELLQILAEELQLKRQQEEDRVGITLCLEKGRSDTALEIRRQELELESTHLSQRREAEANLPVLPYRKSVLTLVTLANETDYDVLKQAVLDAYLLSTESYRRRFNVQLYEQKVELERACEQERLQTLQHEAERQQADLQRQRQEQEAELQRQRQEQEVDLQHQRQEEEAELQSQRQEQEADLQRQRQEQEAEQQRQRQEQEAELQRQEQEADLQRQRQEQEAELQRQRQEQEAELQRQRQEQEADLRRRREIELLQIPAEELQLKRQQKEDGVGITLCLEQGRSDTALEFRRQEFELEGTHLSQRREAEANLPVCFKPTNCIIMIPPVVEAEVDSFFVSFEALANQLQWPRNQWPILLRSHLTGKAVLTLITLANETDYDVLKQAVLDAYLLSTESYRRRFNVQVTELTF